MKGNIWAQVLARVEPSLRRHEFMEWLQPTSLASDDGNVLEVRISDENVGKWITKHYLGAIQESLTALGRPGVEVNFVVGPPVTDTKGTRTKGPQGKALDFETLEPWERPVAGAALLEDLAKACERFITLPPHASTALALWVLHTYTHEAAFCSPILAITSPIKGCGKTSALIVLGSLVHRRQFASNLTSAVLFRLVDRFQPTLLIDEADTFLPENDQLRGLLNSGHTKATAWLIRNVGEDYDPRKFYTWCPKAIAAIGRLPGTNEDRSIQIRMRRQREGDAGYRRERLRIDRVDGWHLDLRRRAVRWAIDHVDELRQADPVVPWSLADRAADNWRPLFAIADDCGGAWPERARQAAEALSGDVFNDDQEPGVELLRDMLGLFYPAADDPAAAPALDIGGDGVVPTDEILKSLAALPDRPWGTWRGEKPITPHALSKLLRPLNIYPAGIRRVGDQVIRGYRREAFVDAFTRYLPPQLIKCCNPNIDGPKSQNPIDRDPTARSIEKSENTPRNIGPATLDQLDRGGSAVIPLIPSLKRTVARANLPAIPPRLHQVRPTRAAKGKAH